MSYLRAFNRDLAAKKVATAADPKIAEFQKGLRYVGYDPGRLDGVMDDSTRTAIRNFQQDVKVPVTGVMDSASQKAMTNAIKSVLAARAQLAQTKAIADKAKADAAKAVAEQKARQERLEAEKKKEQQAQALAAQWLGGSAPTTATPTAGASAKSEDEAGSWVTTGKAELAKQEEAKRKAEAWLADKKKAAAADEEKDEAKAEAAKANTTVPLGSASGTASVGSRSVLSKAGDLAIGVGKGIGDLAVENVKGMVLPAYEIYQKGKALKEGYEQGDGVVSGTLDAVNNALNPAYHTMVGVHETVEAVERGDYEGAGRHGVHAVNDGVSTVMLAKGLGGGMAHN